MRFTNGKNVKKFVYMMCAAVFFACTFESAQVRVFAAEIQEVEQIEIDNLDAKLMERVSEDSLSKNTRTMLINCSILTSCSEDGLHIEIMTGSAGTASVLGVKDIVIMKKVWYGWKTIATGNGGEDYDCTFMGLMIDYPNVEVGETYRITCVHYGNVNEYTEGTNDTGGFVFQY